MESLILFGGSAMLSSMLSGAGGDDKEEDVEMFDKRLCVDSSCIPVSKKICNDDDVYKVEENWEKWKKKMPSNKVPDEMKERVELGQKTFKCYDEKTCDEECGKRELNIEKTLQLKNNLRRNVIKYVDKQKYKIRRGNKDKGREVVDILGNVIRYEGNTKADMTLEGEGMDWFLHLAVVGDEMLASGSRNGEIKIWNTSTGDCINTLKDHTEYISSLTVLGDGVLVSGAGDGKIKLWNTKTGECIQTMEEGDGFAPTLAVLSNTVFASASYRNIKIWNTKTGEITRNIIAHPQAVNCLAVLDDGVSLVSGDSRTLKVWNTNNGDCERTIDVRYKVECIAVLGDGVSIATNSKEDIKIWDTKTEECTGTLTGHTDYVKCLVVFGDGVSLASACENMKIKIWDSMRKECIHTIDIWPEEIECLAVLGDGLTLASGGEDTIKLWKFKYNTPSPNTLGKTCLIC